jgi:hypothetical protein
MHALRIPTCSGICACMQCNFTSSLQLSRCRQHMHLAPTYSPQNNHCAACIRHVLLPPTTVVLFLPTCVQTRAGTNTKRRAGHAGCGSYRVRGDAILSLAHAVQNLLGAMQRYPRDADLHADIHHCCVNTNMYYTGRLHSPTVSLLYKI